MAGPYPVNDRNKGTVSAIWLTKKQQKAVDNKWEKDAEKRIKKYGSGKSMAMANKTITVKMPKKIPAKSPIAGKTNKIVGAATTQTKSKAE